MDISSNNQLVPYNQGPQPLTPYSPREPRSVASEGNSAARRLVLIPPPQYPRYAAYSGGHDPIYTSSRRIKTPEINQVGLLVNIYA